MNQILYNYNMNNMMIPKNNYKVSKKIKWYKIIFFASLILLTFFIVLFLVRVYKNKQNELISKKLTTSYSISTMYSNVNTSDYTISKTNGTPFVIRNNKNK